MVDLALKYLHLVFVMDACGTNTNMSKDKKSLGNKQSTMKGSKVTVPACTSDVHFTTIGFTALTGDPVFCVVILEKSLPLTYAEINGFDVNAE